MEYKWQRDRDEAVKRYKDQEALIHEELGPMLCNGWTWHEINGTRQYSKHSKGDWLWVELVNSKPSLVKSKAPSQYEIHGLKVGNKQYEPMVFAESYVDAAKKAMDLEEKIKSGWIPDDLT